MEDREILASVLREGRGCRKDAGFPCPFCLWGPDEMTPEHDETGCLWLADACLAALRERGRTIAPDKATIPMMCAGNDVIQELQTRSICSAEVYERMLAVAPKG